MNIEEQKHPSKNCPLFWWTYDTRKTPWKQLHYGHLVTDIWWERRTSETAFFQKSAGLFHCSLRNKEALFTSLGFSARFHTHTHMFNIYIQKTCKYESQSKHWVQHGNPFKIWCCHVAFANGDTFLGELSNLGDHMTWPFICNGYCYTKYQGKERAKHIHPTTIYILYIYILIWGIYENMLNLQLVCSIFCQNTLPNFAAAFKYIFSKKANSTLRPRSRACFVSSAPSHQACNSSKVPR